MLRSFSKTVKNFLKALTFKKQVTNVREEAVRFFEKEKNSIKKFHKALLDKSIKLKNGIKKHDGPF